MVDNPDTIAAIATPTGKGGIGVIRISGPRAADICRSITGEKAKAAQIRYCRFRDLDNHTLDNGIVLYFKAPLSFTGEDVVELQGHGGQVVLNLLLNQVLQQGARLARPGEFTERAFLNNKLDLIQAEAIADLIDSSSEQAVRSAMRSLEGEFSARINLLLADLISIRAFVEGALDFPEEEIDFLSNSDIKQKLKNCLTQLNYIVEKARNGKILNEGINVVIAGPPNAGKSSLLNSLSQTDRAIVTASPGTTRDTIEEKILLDGLHINIVDTAGIRETSDSIEAEGIRRAQQAIAKADIVLIVLEANPVDRQRQQFTQIKLEDGTKTITIYNKIDVLNRHVQQVEAEKNQAAIFLSVKTGEGMDKLIEKIKQLVGVTGDIDNAFMARTRHINALMDAAKMLTKALNQLQGKKPAAELIAEDLQQSQRYLESITGASSADDLLGEIFSSFCIGK